MIDPRVIEAAGRLTSLLEHANPGLSTWHAACEDAYQALLKAAAEESPIVKAARVMIRGRLLLGETLPADVTFHADLVLLEEQIALASDPPYAASPEDDSWVARVRAELCALSAKARA